MHQSSTLRCTKYTGGGYLGKNAQIQKKKRIRRTQSSDELEGSDHNGQTSQQNQNGQTRIPKGRSLLFHGPHGISHGLNS